MNTCTDVTFLPKVLICEDETVLRELISEALESEGFTVIALPSADSGWTYLKHHAGEISLLLSDVCMPGRLDGADLARLVTEYWPDVGIVLSSGYTATTIPSPDKVAFLPKP